MPNVINAETLDEREVTIARIIDAPRTLVFAMWTDPAHLAQWWGPKDFTNPVCELDARRGGALRIVMRAPYGTEHPMTGTFHEIVAPERLVFSSIAIDANGEPLLNGVTTVTFEDIDGKTRLTVHAQASALVPLANRMLEGMNMGWTQSIDRLEAFAGRTHGGSQ